MFEFNEAQVSALERKGVLPKYPMEDLQSMYRRSLIEHVRLGQLLSAWKNPGVKRTGIPMNELIIPGVDLLDIAAGSAVGEWAPHFARLCAINGANVVALDIEPQAGIDQELFDWAQVNLIEAIKDNTFASLPILAGKTFDVVYCADFIGGNPVPGLYSQLDDHNISYYGQNGFESQLQNRAMSFLREGGIATFGNPNHAFGDFWYYTRQNGEITRVA